MHMPVKAPPINRLLGALPPEEMDALRPYLKEVPLNFRDRLYEAGEPLDHVWFPNSGVVSMVTELVDGNPVELATVGPEGMVGVALILGSDRMEHVAFNQIAGDALRMDAAQFRSSLEQCPALHRLELKSSNEEYQSINEELQSANEELETSKEELQSVNEELQTVNGELAYRVGELARTNSDLKNLLESTQIATVFLDNDLRVRSFTPTATDIFRLIETDVGRPIDHIAARIVYPDLQTDIRRVLKTLAVVEREVSGTDGDRNYVVRILPYRSIDNFIAGVVLTFLDVTTAVRAEAALRDSEARLQIAIEVGNLATWDWNLKSGHVTWNETHFRMLGYKPGEIEPSYEAWASRVHPEDLPAAEAALAAARDARQDYEHQFRSMSPDGTVRWCAARGRFFFDEEGREMRMIGVMEDMTERRHAEETQRILVGELQHRTRNLLAIARSIAQQTIRSSTSLDDFGKVYSDRLSALSRVQGLLSKGDGFTVTLGELVRGEIEAHGGSLSNGKVTIDGPELALSSREVQVLTLVLHELATNAVKYGALGKPDGRLSISWSVDKANGQAAANIDWVETGVGVDVRSANGKRGFGRDLIERAVPYDLGAKTSFEFRENGIRCELHVPIGTDDEMYRGARGETDGG